MPEKILDAALDADPMWGIIVGLLLIMLLGAGVALRVLWKENRRQDEREREGLERALILLDKVGDGLKAAERDRELRATDRIDRVQFETEMRQAFSAFNEIRSAILDKLRDNHDNIMRAVERRNQ